MYLDTERVFSGDRLIEIAQKRFPRQFEHSAMSACPWEECCSALFLLVRWSTEYYKDAAVLKSMSSSVRHVTVSTAPDLLAVLKDLESRMLEFNCKLVSSSCQQREIDFHPIAALSAHAACSCVPFFLAADHRQHRRRRSIPARNRAVCCRRSQCSALSSRRLASSLLSFWLLVWRSCAEPSSRAVG